MEWQPQVVVAAAVVRCLLVGVDAAGLVVPGEVVGFELVPGVYLVRGEVLSLASRVIGDTYDKVLTRALTRECGKNCGMVWGTPR